MLLLISPRARQIAGTSHQQTFEMSYKANELDVDRSHVQMSEFPAAFFPIIWVHAGPGQMVAHTRVDGLKSLSALCIQPLTSNLYGKHPSTAYVYRRNRTKHTLCHHEVKSCTQQRAICITRDVRASTGLTTSGAAATLLFTRKHAFTTHTAHERNNERYIHQY